MRLLFTLFILSASLVAQTTNELFKQASISYEQKEYYEALNLYEGIESTGQFSSEIYFNKANCYYKLQQNAEAVLYYEKALKLNPSDEDAQFNLHLVQLRLVDKLAQVPQTFYQKWISSIKNLMSIDLWAKAGILFLFIFSGLFIAFIFSNVYRFKKKAISFSMISISLAAITLSLAYYSFNTQKTEAILMQDNAYIKSAPSSQSEDLFILHEGTKIEVLELFNDWTKIKLSDGMIGWLESESVEGI
jgi:tetratricopeptide (TPR) repeat protein